MLMVGAGTADMAALSRAGADTVAWSGADTAALSRADTVAWSGADTATLSRAGAGKAA